MWPAIDWPSWFTSFPSLTFLPNFNSRTEVFFYFGLINTSFHSPGIEPATNQSAWVTFPFPLCQQLSILQIDSICSILSKLFQDTERAISLPCWFAYLLTSFCNFLIHSTFSYYLLYLSVHKWYEFHPQWSLRFVFSLYIDVDFFI